MGGTAIGRNDRLFPILNPETNGLGYPGGLAVVAQCDILAANQRPDGCFRIKSIEPDGKKRRLHRHAQSFSQRSFSRTRPENVDPIAFIEERIKKIKARKMVVMCVAQEEIQA